MPSPDRRKSERTNLITSPQGFSNKKIKGPNSWENLSKLWAFGGSRNLHNHKQNRSRKGLFYGTQQTSTDLTWTSESERILHNNQHNSLDPSEIKVYSNIRKSTP